MTEAALADQTTSLANEARSISRGALLKWFAALAAVSFLLRIVYAGHLYEDDGLWFTVGEEIVRGKALYSEIYFDKPPGLALVYALLFWLFGAHIIVVRLFTIAYSVAIAAMIYLFGSRLYCRRIGLLAAAFYSVFSTTYVTGHVQSLSTDMLMTLPYTAAAYFMVRSMWGPATRTESAWLSVAGGVSTGLAFQINPKGCLDLAFFAMCLIASWRWRGKGARQPAGDSPVLNSFPNLFACAAGFVAATLPFIGYIAVTRAFRGYWLYVWDWGARYGGYYGPARVLWTALSRTADYLALNNTLLVGLGYLVASTARRTGGSADPAKGSPGAGFAAERQPDIILLMWLAVSYAGVMIGGRFFGHYFLQILPALCLIGARGLSAFLGALRARSRTSLQAAVVLLALGFTLTLIRFHGRGLLVAADFIRGKESSANANWYYNQRAREERMVAAVVRDAPDGPGAANEAGLETLRIGGPRTRAAEGPADYLFVWGYRPEIYFWSGLLPASRFLSSQPLTGVPADVHYFRDDYRSVLDPSVTAAARADLVRDLQATQPKYIVDEIGFFNNDLAILRYPELRDFMNAYKPLGATGRFFIYVRNDLRRKYQLRHSTGER